MEIGSNFGSGFSLFITKDKTFKVIFCDVRAIILTIVFLVDDWIFKSNHIVTNHAVDGQSTNSSFGFRGNGFFNGGLTTIREKSSKKVYYNQIEGALAHCTVFDKNNNRLISDESVLIGEIYQLVRFGEHIFLEPKGLYIFNIM